MKYLRIAIACLLILSISASLAITLRPGDNVTISGCTTLLEISGNVVRCATRSATPSRTATAVPSATATRTPAATASVTLTPTLTLTFLPTITKEATALVGLAIIGDSTQDEYAAPENGRPAVNWAEHLALSGLPLGAWQSNPEPRRNGFAYNWARSGATSAQALASQAPGVVAQIQSGQVSHVLIQVGINDFNSGLAASIYAGPNIDYGALNHIADNILATAGQVAAVAPGRVIVAATQDYLLLNLVPNPEYGYFTNPDGIARSIAAAAYMNERIRTNLPAGAIWFDFNAAMAANVNAHRSGDILLLDGQLVQIRTRGSGPLNGFINDPYMHPETAISGLYAQVYIAEMNAVWGLNLSPLTDAEVMARAQ